MSFGNQSPCDPQGLHAQLRAELTSDGACERCQRALELLDARLTRTRAASGFLRRLRAVLEGARS